MGHGRVLLRAVRHAPDHLSLEPYWEGSAENDLAIVIHVYGHAALRARRSDSWATCSAALGCTPVVRYAKHVDHRSRADRYPDIRLGVLEVNHGCCLPGRRLMSTCTLWQAPSQPAGQRHRYGRAGIESIEMPEASKSLRRRSTSWATTS